MEKIKEEQLMRKIKLFPFPHVEIRISVSDEMERDYWKCRESIRNGLDEQMRGEKTDETDRKER